MTLIMLFLCMASSEGVPPRMFSVAMICDTVLISAAMFTGIIRI